VIRSALAVGLVLLFAGCGSKLPDPVLHSVEPSSFQEGDAPTLRVAFDAIRPAWANYGSRALGLETGLEVRVADQVIFSADAFDGNEVSAQAPFGLQPGRWDASVRVADGRVGILPGAVTVTPGEFPLGYAIDPIPDQVHAQSFDITIHAEGGNAATYTGVLQLTVNHGKITPAITAPFSGGSVTAHVTISSVDKGMVITVKDAAGNQADSNAFAINP
jgi:hypothetical protein